jgi:hypothetical protein
VALTNRLPARMRWMLAVVVAGLCAVGVTVAFGWLDRDTATSGSGHAAIAADAQLAGFSVQRLTSELGGKYGFHFMSAQAPADPGSVDMATARDADGNQMRVIIFGRAPEPVHGLVCEFTPAPGTPAQASAQAQAASPLATGFLTSCARLGAGEAQAEAAADWFARAQAGLAAAPASAVQANQGRLTAQARFATAGYVVRLLPETGEWIMAITSAGS